MLAPRLDNMVPYRLVVYRDGQAIADLAHIVRLSETELVDLVTGLDDDLAGQPAMVSPAGRTRVMDAGVTILGVRTGSGERTVSADALGELRDAHAYPDAVYAARDLLGALADRVNRDGGTYTADQIRLFAQPAGGAAADNKIGVWPIGVPVPDSVDQYGVRRIDLAGARVAA
jgi:hypothetical protein